MGGPIEDGREASLGWRVRRGPHRKAIGQEGASHPKIMGRTFQQRE